jgi:hypothetical protein
LITGLTAILTLSGVAYLWFFKRTDELPYLHWLLVTVILEIVSFIVIFAKKGFKYLPEIRINKNQKKTLEFMEQFISMGTSATIVSNRVSWLASNENLISILKQKIDSGIRIEIITPNEVAQSLREKLTGANFIVTGEHSAPEARFTLINGDRSGSEKLAIAQGVHPEHEITIFDNYSGPQIIAMAKDIVRKSKGCAHG